LNGINLSNWVRSDLKDATGRSVTCNSDVFIFAPFYTLLFFSEPIIDGHSYEGEGLVKHGFGGAIIENSAFVIVEL
jgi:hypothetical protein